MKKKRVSKGVAIRAGTATPPATASKPVRGGNVAEDRPGKRPREQGWVEQVTEDQEYAGDVEGPALDLEADDNDWDAEEEEEDAAPDAEEGGVEGEDRQAMAAHVGSIGVGDGFAAAFAQIVQKQQKKGAGDVAGVKAVKRRLQEEKQQRRAAKAARLEKLKACWTTLRKSRIPCQVAP
eukprot:scaffold4990_cov387-Prasinococcus_capsulatus_cf.AAC.14